MGFQKKSKISGRVWIVKIIFKNQPTCNKLTCPPLMQHYRETKVLKRLVSIQYVRETKDFYRGSFRVSGDRVDVFPANEEDRAYRLEFFGDEIEKIVHMDPLTGEVFEDVQEAHNLGLISNSTYNEIKTLYDNQWMCLEDSDCFARF